MQYILYAIPAFFILIGVELLIDRLKKTGYYRLNDTVTNINLGVGSQLAGLFIKGLTLGAYIYIYTNYRLIESIPQNIITFALLFIGIDFFYYWFHRLAHEIGVLWGSHVVHHQSEEYNFSVALRQSWTQGMFSWVFYLPLALIGFSVELFVLINALQTLYQFWIHTKLIHKLPKAFEFVFNTPSHHRVHHGQNPLYIDRNHGGTLIIFDRMFGTFQEEEEEVVYGITKPANSWNPLWLNIEYWLDWAHNFVQAKGLLNKLKTIYKFPGWQANQSEVKSFNPAAIKKYDVAVSKQMNYYVLFHFIIVLLLSSLLLNILGSDKAALLLYQKVIVAIFVIYSLFAIGALLEKRSWSLFVEIFRLLTFPICIYYISQVSVQVPYYSSYFFMIVSIASMLFLLLNNKNRKTI